MRSQIENRAESQEVQGVDGLERYDAFISYAREDSAFVGDQGGLLEALGKQGLSVWLDVEAIPGGADFHTRIRRGIETSNGFVFVMTPDSVASKECRRELEFAIELGKLIIPVYHRDVARRDLPAELANPQWIFLRSAEEFEAGVLKLAAALSNDLEWRDKLTTLTAQVRGWQNAGGARSFSSAWGTAPGGRGLSSRAGRASSEADGQAD